jgi:hypothetical protein
MLLGQRRRGLETPGAANGLDGDPVPGVLHSIMPIIAKIRSESEALRGGGKLIT